VYSNRVIFFYPKTPVLMLTMCTILQCAHILRAIDATPCCRLGIVSFFLFFISIIIICLFRFATIYEILYRYHKGVNCECHVMFIINIFCCLIMDSAGNLGGHPTRLKIVPRKDNVLTRVCSIDMCGSRAR
jgi:hypothetical protein